MNTEEPTHWGSILNDKTTRPQTKLLPGVFFCGGGGRRHDCGGIARESLSFRENQLINIHSIT